MYVSRSRIIFSVAARLLGSPGNGSVSSARSPWSLTYTEGGTENSGASWRDWAKRAIASWTCGLSTSPSMTISAGLSTPSRADVPNGEFLF